MRIRTTSILGVFAVGVAGGVVLYASQFVGPAGPSPAAIQRMQLVRGLGSLAVLAGAGLAGYSLFDSHTVRRSYWSVLALFLLSGIVGYGAGFTALVVAPPSGFTVGSVAITAGLVGFEEVLPFTLAGFSGASVRALRHPARD